ncbi:hypothetical protein LOK49_LG08G01656 [Camellia lanceoleosa]|uniref:Uncharacterized protein n=1 Tax=Camellia lanceoleosa TaxID=1840588 RepID=A0ACC0GPQ6_9ERIC|nr:hypothetical protein LOK49_LG08G01656 [Camellia lanceoleosa]
MEVSRHMTRPKLLLGVLVSASYRAPRGGFFLRSVQAFVFWNFCAF